jgi:cell wall-associated NlpC family hydrolase
MNKVTVKIVAFGLVLGMSITHLQTAVASTLSNAKEKKQEAEGNLDSAQNQIKVIEDKQASLRNQISKLDEDLVGVIMDLNILQDDIKVKEKELKKVQADLDEAKANENEQYEAMKKRIVFMYEGGDTTFLTAILASQNISDLLNRVEYYNEVYDYDRELLTTFQTTKLEVAQLKKDVQGQIAEMQEMQVNLREQENSYRVMIDQKRGTVADFDSKLVSAQALAAEYQATITASNTIIRQEEARIAEERQAERDRLEAARLAASRAAASAASQRTASNDTNDDSDDSDEILGAPSVPADFSNNDSSDNEDTGSSDGDEQEPADEPENTPSPVTNSSGSAMVDYAYTFIGKKYVYGGTDPYNGIDCSAFTQYIYAHFGKSIPRTSSEQRSAGVEVSYSEAQPGDLICYSGHVALYAGGGQIVHASNSAPYPQGGIKTSSATYRTILSVRRVQ